MINKRNEAWVDKDNRKNIAINHCKYIDEEFHDITTESITNTLKYESFKINDTEWSDEFTVNSTVIPVYRKYTKIILTTDNTVDAIINQYNYQKQFKDKNIKIAALNFASFTNPGGKFLEGSFAQEEFLCHYSNLYNILIHFDGTFYEYNRSCKNNGLYHNNSLYTPNVAFIINNEIKAFCDIITCAAPNTNSVMKYKRASYIDCVKYMISRIDHILDVAKKQGVTHLILGAFGCGVFGNNPTDVAVSFMSLLTLKYKNVFDTVEFAIPISYKNDNNEKFNVVIRTFEAYNFDYKRALQHYDSVRNLISDCPWFE